MRRAHDQQTQQRTLLSRRHVEQLAIRAWLERAEDRDLQTHAGQP
jgi:hypothetical protein